MWVWKIKKQKKNQTTIYAIHSPSFRRCCPIYLVAAAASLLGSAVPRLFAILDMASIVMIGRLCCRRWDAVDVGVDCVRA